MIPGKTKLMFVLILSSSSITFAQDVYTNYYRALQIVDSAITNCGGLNNIKQPISFTIKGEERIYGHYSTPEKFAGLPLRGVISAAENKFFAKLIVSEGTSDYPAVEFITADSSFNTTYTDSRIRKSKKEDNLERYFYSPYNVLQTIHANRSTLHAIANDVIGFNVPNGDKYYVYFDKQRRINKVERLFYDNMYGDTKTELTYSYSGATTFPEKETILKKGLITITFTISEVAQTFTATNEEIKSVCNTFNFNAAEKTNTADIQLEDLSNGLWMVLLLSENNKILVSESKDFISVYEAPGSTSICRQAAAFLRERFKKPIRYCFLSHHHPDHAGGFLAFSEVGATIVTTDKTANYLRALAKQKHSLALADHYSFQNPTFDIIPLTGQKEFLSNDFKVSVIEIGVSTDHTEEYLAFYFPKQKTLFIGDLVIFPAQGVYPQRKRAYAVYDLIKTKKLKVEKIYTSWPLHNQKAFGTPDDLLMALKQAYPDLKK